MTLDKAIEIHETVAGMHERDAEYHRPLGHSHESIANVAEGQAREERQIAEWLKELKAYRETYPYGVDRFNGSDTPQTERRTDRDGDVWEWRGDAWYCIGQADTPQTDCGWGEPNE